LSQQHSTCSDSKSLNDIKISQKISANLNKSWNQKQKSLKVRQKQLKLYIYILSIEANTMNLKAGEVTGLFYFINFEKKKTLPYTVPIKINPFLHNQGH
jgi:hypothetical protein